MAETIVRTTAIKGLNRAPYIADGEMRDMKNMCSDSFPFASSRKGRTPYTFTTYIDSPEGEAYNDIERLPTPCEEENRNVYKITTDAPTNEYISGEFYYYDAENAAWVQGIKDSLFKGLTDKTIETSGYTMNETLKDTDYSINSFSDERYAFNTSDNNDSCNNNIYRYIGEDTECFKKGKFYQYKIYIEAYWKKGTGGSNWYMGERSSIPTPSIFSANHWEYFYYTGDSTEEYTKNTYYVCVLRGYGYWEEVEAAFYEPVIKMPEEPFDGQQVRYINTLMGAPIGKAYYLCNKEMSIDNEDVYFYTNPVSATKYSSVNYLPEASANNLGKTFDYTGVTTAGQFAECVYSDGGYEWKTISHPQVSRIVTLKDWLDNYDGSGITSIIEIGQLNGKLAALVGDENNEPLLYYEQKLWDIGNITEEPGKKLQVVGNKLVVGESGSYLCKDSNSAYNLFEIGGAFSRTLFASRVSYGYHVPKSKDSYIQADSSGNITFYIVQQGGRGQGFETVYNGLKIAGTNFKATFDGETYYLKSKSITYHPDYEVAGDSLNGDWTYWYADILEIKATGFPEIYYWDDKKGFGKSITFASTDPHYYDVVAWKKRLWGYSENVLHGTAADIFDENKLVDWTRGDNTYMEAISQPIWQGGKITGLAALCNALVIFKEDNLTVFTGNYPAVMQGSTVPCKGLSEDNRRSVAVANEAVYYLSQDGVYKFTGALPICISKDVKISGTDAVGASDGRKYYLSLKEDDGNYSLYVYDIDLNMWHKEDNTHATSFTMLNGKMYMADYDKNEIYNLNALREDVDWEAEFWFDEGTHRKKKYKEFYIRGSVGECEMYLKADEGEWKLIKMTEDKLHIKIAPFECEELSIKLKGKGICEIKSVERVYELI